MKILTTLLASVFMLVSVNAFACATFRNAFEETGHRDADTHSLYVKKTKMGGMPFQVGSISSGTPASIDPGETVDDCTTGGPMISVTYKITDHVSGLDYNGNYVGNRDIYDLCDAIVTFDMVGATDAKINGSSKCKASVSNGRATITIKP